MRLGVSLCIVSGLSALSLGQTDPGFASGASWFITEMLLYWNHPDFPLRIHPIAFGILTLALLTFAARRIEVCLLATGWFSFNAILQWMFLTSYDGKA